MTTATQGGFVNPWAYEPRIHPLLRGFLLAKLQELPPDDVQRMVQDVVAALVARRRWDECLAALEYAPINAVTASVLNEALAELLDSGRIATVRRWVVLAHSSKVDDPVVLLAEAEIAVRDQDHLKA